MKSLSMRSHNTEGKLITFCGLDGCGKTSIIKMLTDKLKEKNIDFLVTKQPTDHMRSSAIFRTFMDCEDNSAYEYRALALMAAADRIQHTNKIILPALEEGKTVICDRYFYSCLANLRARGYANDEWIYEISENIIRPDVALFLDVPVDIAVGRVRMRQEERERYINIELQHLLKKEFEKICNENQGILIRTDSGIDSSFDVLQKHLYKILGDKYKLGGFYEN